MYAFGYNGYYQSGAGSVYDLMNPTRIQIPQNETVKSVHGTYLSTIFVMESGLMYGVGYNADGSIGFADNRVYSTLTVIPMPMNTKVKKATVDRYASYVVLEDGTLYATGLMLYGAQGNGSTSGVNRGFSGVYFPDDEEHYSIIKNETYIYQQPIDSFIPTRAHDKNEFIGWFLDESGTIPFVETYMLDHEIVVYAKWT